MMAIQPEQRREMYKKHFGGVMQQQQILKQGVTVVQHIRSSNGKIVRRDESV